MLKQAVVLFLCWFCGPLAVAVEQAYVSETLSVWLHAGPGNNYRIMGSLSAGEPLSISGDVKGNYTPVVDGKGREGWVESKLLSATPGYRQQAATLQQQLHAAHAELAKTNEQLSQQTAQLNINQQELVNVRQQLATLQARNNALSAAREDEDQARQLQWFKYGAMVLGSGVLLGLLLTLIPWRRQPKRWM